MYKIDLNCDMGEGLPNDAQLMPWVSSANIACGYHAGDEDTMRRTTELAMINGVSVGAHPGFADKPNFGRTELQLHLNEIYDLVTEQVYLLQTIAVSAGTRVKHVKPHGALYNMSARNPLLAQTIAQAVKDIDPELRLFGLSGSCSIEEAEKQGLGTASEVFADRTYLDDGSLTPRSLPNALIVSEEASLQQVLQMIQEQCVTSISGKKVPINAETVCIHGDGKNAVAFIKQIYQTLQQKKIGIQSI